ncbi:hypothetical protein MPTK1_8g00930 [Marchantia polymorpha subsp. ruderalis]
MASILGSCGRVGLVTVSIGYMAARMTAAVAYTNSSRKDFTLSDQTGPNTSKPCSKNLHDSSSERGVETALQTALR